MELVEFRNGRTVTTSLQVSERFNKNHQHILRDIDNLKEGVQNWTDLFYEDKYIHPQNKQEYRQVVMNKDGFTLLAMGFTGKKALEFKLKYIEAFNQMEERIKEERLELPSTPMEILELTFQAQKETDERVEKVEKDVKELKDLKKLEPGMYNFIGKAVSNKINATLEDLALNKKTQKPLRSELNRNINELAGVKTRTQIKEKDFDKIIDFIERWQPSTITLDKAKAIQLELDEVEEA